MSITMLSDELNLPPSTTHRLVQTMLMDEFVEQDHTTQRYRLGPRLIEIGQAAAERINLGVVSEPIMRELALKTGWGVNLARLQDDWIVYIQKVTEFAPLSVHVRVGQRRKAYCRALGKVLLAQLTDEEVRSRVRDMTAETPFTITDMNRLLVQLQKVREQAYGVDDQEAALGCYCLAVSVYDGQGGVPAALSISGTTSQSRVGSHEGRIEELRNAAYAISYKLGFRGERQGSG